MTDMAPNKSAEARRRRERLAGMYLSALGNQAAKFNAKPDDLAKALRVWLFGLCREAAHAGADAPCITAAERDKFYRQFLSQTRQSRWGPIEFTTEAQWRQQIAALEAEYDCKWNEPVKQARAA